MKGVNKVILDNGLTVIMKQDDSQPIATVQVWVKTGSVNENDKTSGLSHFLEHLIFKGTDKYPGQEISRMVETQGGVINAATSKEFTYFYIDTQKDGLPEAINILADAMSNAVFPKDEIDKERPVVIEEIMRHYDDPFSTLYDKFSSTLYLKTPYKRSVLGSEDVIKNVSRDEIHAYYKSRYAPENITLVIAGDFDTAKTLELVKATFGMQKNTPVAPQPDLIEPQHSKQVLKESKKVAMTYMLAGFLGPELKSNEQYAGDISGMILGSGRSSRLVMSLREKKELVYSIGASFSTQRGTGDMTVYAVFSKEKEKKVIDEINKEITKLMEKGPSDEELKRAKELIRSQWIFENETVHDKASLFGYWETLGCPEFYATYLSNIEKVTKKDVSDFFTKYYKPQGLNISLIVPEESK
jgi:predicted Zn-dependent peptidase